MNKRKRKLYILVVLIPLILFGCTQHQFNIKGSIQNGTYFHPDKLFSYDIIGWRENRIIVEDIYSPYSGTAKFTDDTGIVKIEYLKLSPVADNIFSDPDIRDKIYNYIERFITSLVKGGTTEAVVINQERFLRNGLEYGYLLMFLPNAPGLMQEPEGAYRGMIYFSDGVHAYVVADYMPKIFSGTNSEAETSVKLKTTLLKVIDSCSFPKFNNAGKS